MLPDLNHQIDIKVSEIYEVLKRQFRNGNLALMGDGSGKALFFLQKYITGKDECDLEFAISIIDKVIESLENQTSVKASFSNGLAGFGWLLTFAARTKAINIDTAPILQQLDEIVIEAMQQDLASGNYDFLHGAVGIGHYLLSRDSSEAIDRALKNLVSELDRWAIHDEGTVKWTFYNSMTREYEPNVYNLGLSHGMPSIMLFLAGAFAQGVEPQICKKLIQGSVQFIINQQQDHLAIGSYFSSMVGEGKAPDSSRLAWCYGDLGIAYAMLRTNEIHKNAAVYKLAMEILKFSAAKKGCIQNRINDAGFCHGTSGIAYIFRHLYLLTGDEEFLASSEEWYRETLAMAKFPDGLAGYKTYRYSEEQQWSIDATLLEGISGIGLSLLAYRDNKMQLWPQAFLL